MISFINRNILIYTIILIFLIFLVFIYFFLSFDFLKSASIGITLTTVVITLLNYIWPFIWKLCPSLNEKIFPNLSGKWKIDIKWEDKEGRKGIAIAECNIKQSLFKITISIENDSSYSSTLSVSPRKENSSEDIYLGYIYQCVPKYGEDQKKAEIYYGAANLRVVNFMKLKGNYFTSKQGRGLFIIEREEP